MKLIAHRGIYDNSIIRENTMKSIRKALINKDYDGVEFDIRVTKDHEFVVYHDPTINGKLIKNMNLYELPKYVPKLSSVLRIRSKKIFLVELKYIGDNMNKLITLLNKYPNKDIYLTSFNTKLIEKISKSNRTFKVGILNYVLNSTEISNLDFICILDTLLTDSLVLYLKRLKKDIFSYAIIKKSKVGAHDVYYIVDDEALH